jgi:hypothetical protein
MFTVIVPVVVAAPIAAAAAIDPNVEATCAGHLSGTTFTLTSDCDTTVQLTVPAGHTLNGGGHTITAHDPMGGNFMGAVLTNGGTAMTIENLTILGKGFATDCATGLLGIFFNDGGGSLTAVNVENITQHNGCAKTGTAIRANGIMAARTVTMTNVKASGYQKSALVAAGSMTVNVNGSTLGPPDSLKGVIAQNGVQYSNNAPGSVAAAGGTITGTTIYGSGFGSAANNSTAVLLFGAKNVTLMGDTITGAGTDTGISVVSGSTAVVINRNQIGRTSPDSPDSFGMGVKVDSTSSAVVTCNTFTGWITDYEVNGVPAVQPLCITTTTLPDGTVAVPYSATLTATGGTAPYTWSLVSGSLPPGLAPGAAGVVSGTPTKEGIYDFTAKVTDAHGQSATQPLTLVILSAPPPPKTQGYWITAGDGGVFTFGSAAFHGSAATVPLGAPVVGIAATPNGSGYWLGAKDGGVFSYAVPFHGSLGNVHLAAPIVGIAATPDGLGYYLVGSDGGVFTFGDAHFKGSLGGVHLAAPIVGIAVTADNQGYVLVGQDGGVFTFGDAHFQGSLGGAPLNTSVAGIAIDNATHGYWLVGANGSLFNFGAPSFGSVANIALAPLVGIAATQDGLGYRFVGSDGGVFCFGNAAFLGSLAKTALNKPAVGMTSIG